MAVSILKQHTKVMRLDRPDIGVSIPFQSLSSRQTLIAELKIPRNTPSVVKPGVHRYDYLRKAES